MTVKKSCKDCPCYLSADEVPGWFGKSIGAPMCARHGYILGKPGLKPVAQAAVCEAFAAMCADYGSDKPATPPKDLKMTVTTGDTKLMGCATSTQADKNAVSRCDQCARFVPAEVVADEFGWKAPMCAKTGRLLFTHKLNVEARNCEWRVPGEPYFTTTDFHLTPAYGDAFKVGMTPMDEFVQRRKEGKGAIEPSTYPTDLPVTPENEKEGIRAWRLFHDPEGYAEPIPVPIYNRDWFSIGEQAKIPNTGDDEHPEWYVDHAGAVYDILALWFDYDMAPLVNGEPGTGKTELFRHIAWLMQMPFDRVNIYPESLVSDVLGKTEVREVNGAPETYFNEGVIPKRWVLPGILLLDEPNSNEDIWFVLRPLTDNSKQLVLKEDKGQSLERNGCCFLGMAINPAWDMRNVGTKQIATADVSRLAHVALEYPEPEIEKQILLQWCEMDGYVPDAAKLETIMNIAADLRQLSKDGTVPISWGIRDQVQVARFSRRWPLSKCYALAVGNALEPEARQAITDLVKMKDGGDDPGF